jgi:opacity protein-like surface antigen
MVDHPGVFALARRLSKPHDFCPAAAAAAPAPISVVALVTLAAIAALALLGGCAQASKATSPQEKFGSDQTYSRLFDASPAQTCEASRRALLSQGYVINTSRADLIEGRKNFQPEPESHMQIEIRVVCAPETADGQVSLGFVTALQDRYALKKSNNSASLGVGVLGSVSLPFTSGNDAMVKIASETVSSPAFYDSFFDLVKRYLNASPGEPARTQ